MEKNTQAYQVKVIKNIEEKEHGYDGEKYLKPDCETTKIFKAPNGMSYENAIKVIARLFNQAKFGEESIKNTIKQFENLMTQYSFEVAEIDDETEVANLYLFVNKKFKIFQKSSLKRQLKRDEGADFDWVKKDVDNNTLDEIYEEINMQAPRIINYI